MQRLSGLDASFLALETPCTPMHVAGLAVFDPSTMPGGFSADTVKEAWRQRLHLAPPFRRRLVEVPLGLHHPLWVEDPDFDLDFHVRHIAVPSPGGDRELATLAQEIVAWPLDRRKPLWQMWIIEGLEHGYFATLTKVHHAAIDGVSGNEITVAVLDLEPDPAPPAPPDPPWRPERIPDDAELIGYAVSSLARQPLRLARATQRTAAAALTLRRYNRRPGANPPPSPFSAPRLPWNTALSQHRGYAMTTLSLDDAKAVKNAFGVKLNDVVMAMCAGALRHYLDDRGTEADGSLVAMIPVSVRSTAEAGTGGNRVSMMLATLATDIDDPVERLQRIAAGMVEAKGQQELIGADALQDWVEFAAPALAGRAARVYSRTRMADRHRPAFNLTISNVPGPPFPLYSAGARLVAHYPMGPVFDGAGLNITVMSYQRQLDFGIVTDRELVPDPWAMAQGLQDALAELKKRAAQV